MNREVNRQWIFQANFKAWFSSYLRHKWTRFPIRIHAFSRLKPPNLHQKTRLGNFHRNPPWRAMAPPVPVQNPSLPAVMSLLRGVHPAWPMPHRHGRDGHGSFSWALVNRNYPKESRCRLIPGLGYVVNNHGEYVSPLKIGLWDHFQNGLSLHGLYMGVILTTYDTWDDPPSRCRRKITLIES